MRIGVVNDLSIAVEAIRRLLAEEGKHEIGWVACNGAEAVTRCAQATPDLVLMDLIMPTLNGVESIQRIMAATPCSILVVTADLKRHADLISQALSAGAIDAVETPVLGMRNPEAGAPLLKKIAQAEKKLSSETTRNRLRRSTQHIVEVSSSAQLVAIGASAGGPAALVQILQRLPISFCGSVVIVQHLDSRFLPELTEWLADSCGRPIRLARRGDELEPGAIFLSNTDSHLILNRNQTLGYLSDTGQCVYCPSIDIFFRSLVQHWKGKALGVLLTGMGRDGAEGLKMMREAGHRTIAQDRDSSVVYGMPKAAADLEAAGEVLPLPGIAAALANIFTPSDERKLSRVP